MTDSLFVRFTRSGAIAVVETSTGAWSQQVNLTTVDSLRVDSPSGPWYLQQTREPKVRRLTWRERFRGVVER